MKEIPLINSLRVVLVDDEDYEWASQYRWRANISNRSLTAYAVRTVTSTDKKRQMQLMHREIMRPVGSLTVDHINGNGLDNRRANLRIATQSQQQANRQHPIGVSGYRGVEPQAKKWVAKIRCNNVRIRIGIFATPEEAAKAYDKKAQELFGEFANLNFSNRVKNLNRKGAEPR